MVEKKEKEERKNESLFILRQDGLINVKKVKSIFGKDEGNYRFNDWILYKTELLHDISKKLKIIPVSKLYHIGKGGNNNIPGSVGNSGHIMVVCEYIEHLPEKYKTIIKPQFKEFLQTIGNEYELFNTKDETPRVQRKSNILNETEIDTSKFINTEPNENQAISKSLNQLFKFQEKEIRVLGTVENPWFIGKEIAELLKYKDTKDAIKKHVESYEKTTLELLGEPRCFNGGINEGRRNASPINQGERIVPPINMQLNGENDAFYKGSQNATPINMQSNTILINESGLYSLILKSKMKAAKEFKKYVTTEILPSIRKKGYYIAPQLSDSEWKIKFESSQLELENNKMNTKKAKFDAEELAIINERSKAVAQDIAKCEKYKRNIYFSYIGEHPISANNNNKVRKFKFGKSYDMSNRDSTHCKNFPIWTLMYIWRCENMDQVETEFKNRLRQKGILTTFKSETEVTYSTEEFGVLDIIKLLETIINQYPYVKPLEQENIDLKYQLEINELKKENEILKLKLLLAQNNISIP